MIAALLPIILPVFSCAAIGYGWARSPWPFELTFVTRLITYIGTPCLVFSTLVRLAVPPDEIGRQVGMGLAAVAVAAVGGIVALRLIGRPDTRLLPTIMLPNAGNLGLPIAYFAFGDAGLAIAIPFSATMTVCHFTVGVACATGRAAWTQILTTPTIWAIVAALLFLITGVPAPAALINLTTLLGGVMMPLMLIALGVSLASLRVSDLGLSAALAALRLAFGLAIGWGLTRAFGLTGAAAGVLILQSAMPPAVFNYLFAVRYGGPSAEIAGAVVLGTLATFVLLPFLLILVVPAP
jgi:predicted permease